MGKPSGPKPQRLLVGLSPVLFQLFYFSEKNILHNKKNDKKKQGTLKHLLIVFSGTFFCATVVSFITNSAVEHITAVYLVFLILLLVVGVGVIFDAIGVASMSANIVPFNARSARKAPGAAITLKLLRKADVVANTCCDVIGDVCGIVSGALGATLVVIIGDSVINTVILSALMAGLVSSLTVGGKAMMKGVAIRNADRIMETVGIILDYRHWKELFNRKNKSEGV